jgi:F-type H+-transporting ATPase subunit b
MEINILQILFQIINFSILLFLLKKYLYKPILNILEQRAKKIHEGLEAAEKSIEEREKLDKEKKKVLVEAEKNATKILAGARIQAKKLEEQLNEKAEIETERKLKKSDALAKTKLGEMQEELQSKFSESVVNTTETLLKDAIDSNNHREIIKNQISELKKVKFSV